ncbi:MAG: DNA methylase, partial [Anabaena sp. CRKS33]
GLNVLASDLNPVAVVTMKAAMEYPLKFGPDLQQDIDKWVKWVGDEAQKRLAEFFPSHPGETVQNYLWAHTVVCPSCESVVPLSPNWWLYKRPEKQNLHKWCAVKPIPNPENKRVDFELVKGEKGKGTTIQTDDGEYDPDTTTTISRGVGKCPNCGNVIDDDIIKSQAKTIDFGHQLYAVAYKKGKGGLEFRTPEDIDFEGIINSRKQLQKITDLDNLYNFPDEEVVFGDKTNELLRYGMDKWSKLFNSRQLLTLVTYVEIINEAKNLIQQECKKQKQEKIIKLESESKIELEQKNIEELENYYQIKFEAISTYLGLVMDRCVDKNCRLSMYDSSRASYRTASGMHALNLMWNYPEVNGAIELWQSCLEDATKDYTKLCDLLGTTLGSRENYGIEIHDSKSIEINSASADNLTHIPDNSVDAVITDPPYYATIQYAELSDFFYVWLKRTLGDIFPELFYLELTDKEREAVANPSRFRNMGISPEELANQDYEAKMSMAFAEYHRVLRDDGVMTVQFNHKDSGAWDVLAKSLIDAGFEITASWAVSTENPQNLHQAQKNAVSSTVLLVCRKRQPNAEQAWWDDVRIEV